MQFSIELLPAPLGPMMARISCSITEIATARRVQQLRWLSERRQLPTAPDAKMTAIRTLLGAFNATGAKITLGERERLTRAIEAVGAA